MNSIFCMLMNRRSPGPSRSSWKWLLGLPACGLVLACDPNGIEATGTAGSGAGSSDQSADDGDDVDWDSWKLRGPCGSEGRIGGFEFSHDSQWSTFSGSVLDGTPPNWAREQLAADGDCVLVGELRFKCEDDCSTEDTCGADGQCVRQPRSMDLGLVEIFGFDDELELTARGDTKLYLHNFVDHPPFTSDQALVVRAAGGDTDGFVLHGAGVTPLQIADTPWQVRDGEPLVVEWEPSDDEHARIDLMLSLDQHGISPATLQCSTEDDGELEITAELVTALLDAGSSGFPNARMRRYTLDSVDVSEGCIDLWVQSLAFPELAG